MKFFTKKLKLLTISCLCFLFFISCGKDEILSQFTNISNNILIKPYRYHSPYRLAIYTKDINNDDLKLVTAEESSNFQIKIIPLGKNNGENCIVNAVGGNQFKITSDGVEDHVVFGISDDYPNFDKDESTRFPIAIIVEDIRTNRIYLTGYKYQYLGEENDLGAIILLQGSDLNSTEKYQKKQIIFNDIPQPSPPEPSSYFNGEIEIQFPIAKVIDEQGAFFPSNTNDNSYIAQVTYLNTDTNEIGKSIHHLSPFPIPSIANEFLAEDLSTIRRIAEFVNTDYIGLNIIHKSTRKKVTKIDQDKTLTITTNVDGTTLNIWRFFEESPGQFKWQEIKNIIQPDSTGQVTFETPLSIGWAISSSPPLAACSNDENVPYATVSTYLTTVLNNVKLSDLYRVELIKDDGSLSAAVGSVYLGKETVSVYHQSDMATILNIYKKRILEADELVYSISIPGCDPGLISEVIQTGEVTRVQVDINDAYCDGQTITIEKTAEIYTIPKDSLPDSGLPDVNNIKWTLTGQLKAGQITTHILKHGQSYWIKVHAPSYKGGMSRVFGRPITIITDGISPNNNNNNGRLICTKKGTGQNQGYECIFRIDDSVPIQDLYLSGSDYCDFL